MELPKSIRVGFRTYRIEDWRPQSAASRGVYGEHSSMEGEIRIDRSYGPIKTADTLLHELLHACFAVGALQDNDDEERTVTVLAHQMTQVMRDNRELVEWLAWATAQEDVV